MDIKTVDRIFAVAIFALGAYIVAIAISYGYMRDDVPGPGYFPLWVGLGMMLLSVVNLVRSLKGLEILTSSFDASGMAKSWAIVALIVGYVLAAPYLGMTLACVFLIPAVAFVIRPKWDLGFTVKVLVTAVVFPSAAYVLFSHYLGVRLITGVFGF